MDKMREEVFEQVYRAGGIRSVRLVLADARASIVYVTGEGVQGLVHTKRGDPKQYRVETALSFLRRCGFVSVAVEMEHWGGGQGQLL